MKMEILQISAYAGATAGNHIPSLLHLEKRMMEQGYTTVYALLETVKNYSWCKELQTHAKVYFLPVKKARILPRTYYTIWRIFQQHEIKLVHSHFELYDIPVTIVAGHKAKIFWHLHDPIGEYIKYEKWSRKLLMHFQYSCMGKSVKRLTVSQKHGEVACRLGFAEKNLVYVPNGLDLCRISNSSMIKKNPEFLMFSWDYYRKGADLAIQACDALYAKNKNFVLKLVPGKEQIVRPYLVNCKPVENVNELYKTAGCFLHLSRSEGLSYALLEAIYAGLPVICSNIPENLPVIDCPTVTMIEAGNVEAIQSAMADVIDSGFIASQRDVEISRKIISERFSVAKWGKDIMNCYFNT